MSADIQAVILDRLSDGESLSSIARDSEMPAYSTLHNWLREDADFAARVSRAREIGYLHRADEAIKAAKLAADPAKGRLAFDAERWYLGKLSNAFSDKQKHELTGADGGAIKTESRIDVALLSDEELRALAASG